MPYLPQLTVLFILISTLGLRAQLITTDPAAPVANEPLTITFDATEGTAGLENCDCDVYLHTGVITDASTSDSDWQFIQTTWGEANDAWKLTPVDGQPNRYTYTFSPSIRAYYGVPEATDIEKIALVFRDATGGREGKAAGGGDIFIEVSSGGDLSLNLIGEPGDPTYPLGRELPVRAGTTAPATISLFDNGELLTSVTGQELVYDVIFTTPGTHTVKVIATAGGIEVADSFSVDAELVMERLSPATSVVNATPGASVSLSATSYIEADLSLLVNNAELFSLTGTTLTQTVTLPLGEIVTYTLRAEYAGETAETTVTFITGDPEVAELPFEVPPGATLLDDESLVLVLRAPGKSDVFVVGNLTDWAPVAATRMKRTPDDTTFWIQIAPEDLPEDDLLYQYAIDGQGRYADPYSTLVLDPDDDSFIGEETFPGIPDYPYGEADGIVTWFRLDDPEYDWEVTDFDRPDPDRMVIYELLVRDFLEAHDYEALTDTLDYLDRLGINTIELLPVSEFEGNISWGYNPSFHMALDKYYGSPEDFKAFVDAAHKRGIAVVLDVVYNHAFGESPLIRMWPGSQSFEPGPDNPYANVTARHPFNVGYDLNHESALTEEYVKVTLEYWIEEFRIDGFRFDLSKGFTQNLSNDVGTWNQYDASRVAIIKDYADHVWSVDEDTYMIMEHLGESREENELAQYGNGMYFWSGFQPHDAYLEGSMGYNEGNKSDLAPALAARRGFDQRSLIAYIESHDEERLVYKNLAFGNSTGDYDVTDLGTALDRAELASTFFYTLPGPKMLWQFGELGYDYSINYCADGRIDESCRTDPKPIVWEYRDEPDRQDLYHHIADLLYLRNTTDLLHGDVMASELSGTVKYVHLSSEEGEVAIVGNFGVEPANTTNLAPSAGSWYDYFAGDFVTVDDATAQVTLAPGEYRVLLSKEVERQGGRLTATNDAEVARLAFRLFPNPATDRVETSFTLERTARVTVDLIDALGRPVRELYRGQLPAGPHSFGSDIGLLPAGTYFVRISDERSAAVSPLIVR
jgi:glycosidase